jgi:hypothetical protein
MIKPLRVFRMKTGTMLKRAINQDGDVEGDAFECLQRLRKAFGLLFREVL